MQGARPRRFKIARDFIALSGGQLLSKVIGFVAFGYLARTLDPASYGAVEYAIGLAVFFSIIIEGGLGPIGVRDVSQSPGRAAALSALIPTARLCIALVAIPAMCLSVYFTGQSMVSQQLAWLFALSLLFVPWNQDWLLQGLEMMNSTALAQVVRMVVFTSGVILFVQSPEDLLRVGQVEIMAVSAMVAYYLTIQGRRIASIRLRFQFRELRQLVQKSCPVGASNLVGSLIHYAPLFLIVNIVGGEEVGWFASSQRVVVSLLTFSWVYHVNLYPTIARRAAASPDEVNVLLRSSFRVVAWAGILVGIVLTLLAEPLLTLAFGELFAIAAPTFAVLIWVLPVQLLSGHARWSLVASGKQRYLFLAQFSGAATSVVIGLVLIPALHALGAAIAVLMAGLGVWAVAHTCSLTCAARSPSLSLVWLPAVVAAAWAFLATAIAANPWVTAGVVAAGYMVTAPLADRRLLTDLRRLAHAKGDLGPKSRAASKTAASTNPEL